MPPLELPGLGGLSGDWVSINGAVWPVDWLDNDTFSLHPALSNTTEPGRPNWTTARSFLGCFPLVLTCATPSHSPLIRFGVVLVSPSCLQHCLSPNPLGFCTAPSPHTQRGAVTCWVSTWVAPPRLLRARKGEAAAPPAPDAGDAAVSGGRLLVLPLCPSLCPPRASCGDLSHF